MSLMRPWSEIQRDMDQLFNQLNGMTMGRSGMLSPMSAGFPNIELSENKDHSAYVLRAEVPGLNPDDINLDAEDNGLVLSGEIKRESESTEDNIYRSEFQYGMFRRHIPVPEHINPEQVKAEYKNGVLTVTMPKSDSGGRKRIQVRSKT